MKLLKLFFSICLFVSAAFAENPKPKIVATTGMITDIVSHVVGTHVDVIGIIGSGVDPHLFKPTRQDIAALSGADVVFYNGLVLEGKMTDALIRVATSGKKVFAVTELLEPEFLLEPEAFQGHYDPHVWMDSSAWIKAVKVIEEKVSGVWPAQREEFQKNAAAYIAKLSELDAYAEKILKTVPKETRVLVTAHDAFNYFGRRYDFEVVGIQGISTESEAGVKDIERIVSLLVSKKIKAVFVETTVSDRNVKALIEGAKAKGHEVKIGGALFSDAMGKAGTYEGTYVGMIDHNVTTIARALGGDAPEKGFQGKLSSE